MTISWSPSSRWRLRSRWPTRRSSSSRCPTSTARSTSRSSPSRGRSPRTTSRSSSARSVCSRSNAACADTCSRVIGLGVFAAASLAVRARVRRSSCSSSAARSKALGAALALVGAIPVLSGIRGSDEHAIRVWGLAGTIGVAVGPALGGFLTQLFSWRSIFLLQAPLAAIALVAVFDRRVRAVERPPRPERRGAHRPRQRRVPRALRRAGRRAVPVGAPARRRVGLVADRGRARRDDPAGRHDRRAPARSPAFPHSVAVARRRRRARGRARRARLPPRLDRGRGPRPRSARAASAWDCSAACSRRPRFRRTVPGVRAATVSIAARHAGFVLALAVIAPVLSASLNDGARIATRATTAEVLDSSVSLRTKVSLAFDLRDLVADAPRGEVPDPTVPFDKRGADTDANLRETRDGVVAAIRDTLTRGFRSSFLIAALFAVAAALAAALLRTTRVGAARRRRARDRGRDRRARRRAHRARSSAPARATFAQRDYVDPCHAPADPFPQGTGIDGTLQRISLSAINGAACELGTGPRGADPVARTEQRLRSRGDVDARHARRRAARRTRARDRRRRPSQHDSRLRRDRTEVRRRSARRSTGSSGASNIPFLED